MLNAGVGRTDITPFPGVELTGWGYYIERVWKRIHDPLQATAVVVESPGHSPIAIVALDLMLIDVQFTDNVRRQIRDRVDLPPESILLTCSHSHNAPAAGGLRGVGECNPDYEQWAARQTVDAVVTAWQTRQPATLTAATGRCSGITFNRTRPAGTVDDVLTVARIDRVDGTPLAVMVSFAGHPTVTTELRPWDVSRDVPGMVCDLLEKRLPGATAVYIQGACGDTNFLREFQTEPRSREPAARLTDA
ncbi:MAG: hypothetical protein KDA96_23495, partial [Planctomycetaceae bacterium]|nr:hypothetical protein [Planctomycetaceae bacterium]